MLSSSGDSAVGFSVNAIEETVAIEFPIVTGDDSTSKPIEVPSLGVYRAIQTSPRLVADEEIVKLSEN